MHFRMRLVLLLTQLCHQFPAPSSESGERCVHVHIASENSRLQLARIHSVFSRSYLRYLGCVNVLSAAGSAYQGSISSIFSIITVIMMNYDSHHPAFKFSNSKFSTAKSKDEHFQRCWAQQSCGGCLDSLGCSWCPYVSLVFCRRWVPFVNFSLAMMLRFCIYSTIGFCSGEVY